ncbi:MAG TPA: multidrug efflux SMR transporter [Chthoniobacteraceae bacterium]|jgi:quaternary ammonium compound-resistance protein SugE
MLPWLYLLLAVATETTFGITLFHSRGFTVLWPTVVAILAGGATVVFLGLAMKHLPIGLAVGIWGGAATLLTFVYGILVLGESMNPARLVCIAFIVIGIFGLKFTTAS